MPETPVVRTPAERKIDPEPARCVVLMVDDEPAVATAVRLMLRDLNAEFHHCRDPRQAIEMALQVRPTVILQDLVMPEMDGLACVVRFRRQAETRDVPMIVFSSQEEPHTKAEAFRLGANDYLVKPPSKLELLARVRYHSAAYAHLRGQQEAYHYLEACQQRLDRELAQAARYVHSLLPEPLTGPIRSQWQFVPSAQLGGDSFGYHWLDDDHLAIYLLDVCGHGLGAALMSISALNTLRLQTLGDTDFRDPAAVLTALNDAFRMERHADRYFTIWYGVYQPTSRVLRWAGAGHPAPLLRHRDVHQFTLLHAQGPPVGTLPDATFVASETNIAAPARLLIFSDGAFEVMLGDGRVWKYDDFVELLAGMASDCDDVIDRVLRHVKTLRGTRTLDDDFSMLQIDFDA